MFSFVWKYMTYSNRKCEIWYHNGINIIRSYFFNIAFSKVELVTFDIIYGNGKSLFEKYQNLIAINNFLAVRKIKHKSTGWGDHEQEMKGLALEIIMWKSG